MQLLWLAAVFAATARAIPYALTPEARTHSPGFSEAEVDWLMERSKADAVPAWQELARRRGGGGGKGGGGKSSSGGSSSSGSSSSSGARPPSGSTSSGRTLGGGSTYPGGSSSSYLAGSKSPSGIAPALIGGSVVGLALGSLYLYPYHTTYHNPNSHSSNDTNLPVECLCQPNDPCGCDDTDNQTSIDEMLKNSSVAKIQTVNGTQTVVINGTLLNSTDAAPGSLVPKGWGAMSGTVAIALLAALVPMM